MFFGEDDAAGWQLFQRGRSRQSKLSLINARRRKPLGALHRARRKDRDYCPFKSRLGAPSVLSTPRSPRLPASNRDRVTKAGNHVCRLDPLSTCLAFAQAGYLMTLIGDRRVKDR